MGADDADRAARAAGWDGVGDAATWFADNCPCDVCRASSPDRSGPRVMTATMARPGESLVGLVARASAGNHMVRLRTLLGAATPTWHVHYNLAARDDVDFAQLAYAGRLVPHEVEARRYRPVAISKDLGGVDFHGATIPADDLLLRARRTAPAWLKVGHHDAIGQHGIVTHCPASGELLIDHCPSCGSALKWTKTALAACGRCGHDLMTIRPERVSGLMRRDTQLMLDIISPDPERSSAAMHSLHRDLAGLDRGVAFELGWRIGRALTGIGMVSRDKLAKLPVAKRLQVLAVGSRALAAWPESVADAMRGRANAGLTPDTVAKNMRAVAFATDCSSTIPEAIRRCAPLPITAKKALTRAGLDDAANSQQLKARLGIGQEIIERLRDTPHLTSVHVSGDLKSHHIFDAANFDALKAVIDDRVGFGAISERLGISRHGGEQLACLGEIKVYDDGPLRSAYVRRQVRRSDLDSLLRRLDAAGRDYDPERQEDRATVLMPHAVRAIGGREKPWGPVIMAMLDGTLPFSIDRSSDEALMKRVRIAVDDVGLVAGMTFDTTCFPGFPFEQTINGRDTESVLNLSPGMLVTSRREPNFPRAIDGLFDRAAIIDLTATHIAASEIVARCVVDGRKMPPPFNGEDGLPRSWRYGWLRAAAEPLMRPYLRVTPRSGCLPQ